MRLFGQEDVLMLQVSDGRMAHSGIYPGDTVVIASGAPLREGDIVAAVLPDGQSTAVGRLHREGTEVRLIPENPAETAIATQEEAILGKVIAVMRSRIH